uniref:transposase n=1 Tax=Candidatus Vondammii sp. HM_W22 TaxID=2687299 RepID=UPI002A4E1E05|nr:transposase [Candidatus Vondammii sp. HM_W22]
MARRTEISPTRIGIDETVFKKLHDYVTVLSDQDAGTVLHVGSDRKKATFKAWYESLTKEQREAIESVSMDMWPALSMPHGKACLGLKRRLSLVNAMSPNTSVRQWTR